MAIISVLVGLILPAVNAARRNSSRAEAVNDITQLNFAVDQFKSTFPIPYVPEALTAGKDETGTQVLDRMFRRYNDTPALNTIGTQSRNETMVFFLSGGGHVSPAYSGFAANSTKPFTTPGGTRNAFFEFKANRMDASGQFLDPWDTPYSYFTAHQNGNDYVGGNTNAMGMFTAFTATDLQPLKDSTNRYLKSHSCQIRSAGPNKVFGAGQGWTPGSGQFAPNGPGGDDLSNFAKSNLSADN